MPGSQRELSKLQTNEYLRFGVEALTEVQASGRALELWKEFGLPNNVRIFHCEKLVPQGRWEISLAPDLKGL